MFSRKGRYMSDQFKITLAQLNATVGDLKGNAQKVDKEVFHNQSYFAYIDLRTTIIKND